MKNLKVPGTGGLDGTVRPCGTGRKHITVLSRNFHSRILENHSPLRSSTKKRFLSFPLLFFRESTGGCSVWNNRFIFPVRFQSLKQTLFQASCENRKKAKNQVLQFSFREGKHGVHQGVPDLRGVIPRNRDAALELILNIQKGVYLRYSSGNKSFYPVLGSGAITNLLHRKIPGRYLLYDPITSQETEISSFFPGGKNRKTIKEAHNWRKSYERSFRMPTMAKKEIQGLDQSILNNLNAGGNILPDINAVSTETFSGRNVVPEKDFPTRDHVSRRSSFDRAAFHKYSASLNPKYFQEGTANLNSRLSVPSDPVFESELNTYRFPGKEVYSQVSGKKLVFNTGIMISQELEKEVAAIKEKLVQAEKISQASYSSIYSKLEEELKQKLEINRLSEQVIQQIVWRLKIEKERSGLL